MVEMVSKWRSLSQGVGKQYSYGKGREELSAEERLKQEINYLRQEIEVLKNTKSWRESGTRIICRISRLIKK